MPCAKCAGRNPIDCYRNNMYTRHVMRDKIIDNAVKRIPDFPKKGILFYDITGILVNPGVFGYCLDKMTERYKNEKIYNNANLSARQIKKYIILDEKLEKIIEFAFKKFKFSARSFNKILKLTRTIADLDGSEEIKEEHLLEAIRYRSLSNKYWS